MPENKWQSLSREDFEQALEEMGHVVDVSVNDLIEVTDKARKYAQLRHKETMRVGAVMSHPVKAVSPDDTLGKAAELMLAQRISGLPVVDAANRLVGIITEADFLCAIGLTCHHPSQSLWQRLEEMFSTSRHELHEPGEKVGAVMARDVVTVTPEQPLHEALEIMKARQVKRLVVVDEDHAPIGIITRSDLVRTFFRRLGWGAEPGGK